MKREDCFLDALLLYDNKYINFFKKYFFNLMNILNNIYKDCFVSNGPNRILDEFVKMLTDAGGAAKNIRKEADVFFRTQLDKAVQKMDVVKREEFEVLKSMLAKAEEERKSLVERLEKLEK